MRDALVGVREEMARVIEELGKEPVILAEQVSVGNTIIEKGRAETGGCKGRRWLN